jgi:hypothetical protein
MLLCSAAFKFDAASRKHGALAWFFLAKAWKSLPPAQRQRRGASKARAVALKSVHWSDFSGFAGLAYQPLSPKWVR